MDLRDDLNFVGISGHLTSGATGHFETFHQTLYDAANRSKKLANVEYLGSSLSAGLTTWFNPVVPPSTVSRIKWSNKKFLNELIRIRESKNGKTLFHIYEGNLFWVLIASQVIRAKSDTYFYLNFFNSSKYNQIIESPIRNRFFKQIFSFLVRDINKNFIFTADSERMAQKLRKMTGFQFSAYPIYATLPESVTTENAKKTLVLIRGENSIQQLFKSLKISPEKNWSNIIVHGVPTLESIKILETEYQIQVSKNHLPTYEYVKFYEDIFRVIVLYDPKLFEDQSSGRLCDATVSGKELIVPSDCALTDMANSYGSYEKFDFGDYNRLAKLLTDPKKTRSTVRKIPTADAAISEILNSIQPQEAIKPKASKKLLLAFMRTALALIWLTVGISYKALKILKISI
jgi:hypothetical protein